MRDGFVYQHHYQDKVQDKDGKEIDNPQSKDDFMKEKIAEVIKSNFVAYEANKTTIEARNQAIIDAEAVTVS